MTFVRRLVRDERGASVVEMAIVLPVLILFLYGIFVVGTMFEASAGMQHALGEGARYAEIFPTPSDEQIKDRIRAKVFGQSSGKFTVADPVTENGFKTLSVTYTQPVDLLFFTAPPLTLTKTKKVYTDF